MADYIPFEIQSEIMKRLPTKSLMRFRSVSKPWKSLIDSPKFIAGYSFNQQHLLVSYVTKENNEQKYISVVDDHTFPLEKVSLPDPIPGIVRPTILGSSQGLFCLYNISRERIVKTVHLWNPSIRKSVAIVVSHVMVPFFCTVFGFGVCPHTSDPKLVKINSSCSLSDADAGAMIFTPWQVEVYSLSSRAWRSIPIINQPRRSVFLLSKQVVIGGLIYWIANVGVNSHWSNVIVSFDLTSEGFMEVSLPDTLPHTANQNVVISKLKGCLVVVEVVLEGEKQVYDVWMMEHGVPNSFAKVFTINSPNASIHALLGYWKNDVSIFKVRTDLDVDDVLVQELHSGHITYIGISGKVFSYPARSYTETLLLLDY